MEDADTVNFQCEGSDDRIADFDLKLMTKLGAEAMVMTGWLDDKVVTSWLDPLV